MSCDICGRNDGSLVDLRDAYKTDEIKQICGGCERIVNVKLDKLRGVTHNILCCWFKRYLTGMREGAEP